MSEASVHFAREDYPYHDVADTQSTSPSEVVMVVEANIDLKDFAIDVYSSEFLCLLDDEASALKQMAALIELKDFIWTRDEFRTKILDVVEIKIVPKTVEKDEEEQNESQQTTIEAQQEENFSKRPRYTQERESDSDNEIDEQDEAMNRKRPRSESQGSAEESEDDEQEHEQEHEPEHEQEHQGLKQSSGNESDSSGNENLIEAGIESDGEEIVTAIADVFKDPQRRQSSKNDNLIYSAVTHEYHRDFANTSSERKGTLNYSDSDNNCDDEKVNAKTTFRNEININKSNDDVNNYNGVPGLAQPATTNAATTPKTAAAAAAVSKDHSALKQERANDSTQSLRRSPSRRKDSTAEEAAGQLENNDSGNNHHDESSSFHYITMHRVIREEGPLGLKVDRYIDVDNKEVPIVTAIAVDSRAHKAGIQVHDILIGGTRKRKWSYDSFISNCRRRPLHLTFKRKVQDTEAEEGTKKIGNIKLTYVIPLIKFGSKLQSYKRFLYSFLSFLVLLNADARRHEEKFVQNLLELKDFYRQHGHYTIPEEMKRLRNWLDNVRYEARLYKAKMKPSFEKRFEMINELENFDWGNLEEAAEADESQCNYYDWKKYDWDTCYEWLKEYKRKHGHCNVSRGDRENPILAQWVRNIKVSRKHSNSNLTPERLQKLVDLGFSWQVQSDRWANMYNRLKNYKEQYGDCLVPKRWPHDTKLGLWVYHQRLAKRKGMKGKLSDERERALDELGFAWNLK